LHALGETAIPPALATVIARACRARVADRLPDADALRAELVAAVEPVPEPVAGPEETLPEPFVPMVGNERSITHDTMTNTATLEQSTATFLAGGRVVRVVETAEQVELSHGSAKLRVSLIASPDGDVHLHVKGINCFVSRVEGRPTGAVALQKDETVQLLSPERRLLGSMKCGFGSPARPGRLFRLGQSSVRVPQPAVLIDFDVSQEVLLIQQARGA
jgi:hypothetical protein